MWGKYKIITVKKGHRFILIYTVLKYIKMKVI